MGDSCAGERVGARTIEEPRVHPFMRDGDTARVDAEGRDDRLPGCLRDSDHMSGAPGCLMDDESIGHRFPPPAGGVACRLLEAPSKHVSQIVDRHDVAPAKSQRNVEVGKVDDVDVC